MSSTDSIGRTWQLSGSLVNVGIGTMRQQYVQRAIGGESIMFKRKPDFLSPQILVAVQGTFVLPEVTLLTPTRKVHLFNARITSMETKAGESPSYEYLTFACQKIEFDF